MININYLTKQLPIIQDKNILSGSMCRNILLNKLTFQLSKNNVIIDDSSVSYGIPLSREGYMYPIQDISPPAQDRKCPLGEKRYPTGNTK